MQQYFIKEEVLKDFICLDEEILHHLKTVLRKGDGYEFRICDAKGNLFLVSLFKNEAKVIKRIEDDKELPIRVTIIMSLIKNEKFDYCLQKLTELGVYRIVPYMAHRSIIKVKDVEHKLKRYQKIVQEAAEQSLRSQVPVIDAIIDEKELSNYLGHYKMLPMKKMMINLFLMHRLIVILQLS